MQSFKALIVYGGWNGHEPEACAHLAGRMLEADGVQVDYDTTLDRFADPVEMARWDLIIPVWTMGEIRNESLKGLLEAVRNGAGLAGWHGGMGDAFRNGPEYQFMCGGQWVAHPDGILDYRVNIVDAHHVITAGLKDFDMHSEQYYLHVDPGNHVLATTTFEDRSGSTPWIRGTVMPVAWTRQYGRGRVFYSSLGHVARDFDIPETAEILRRGMHWAFRPNPESRKPNPPGNRG